MTKNDIIIRGKLRKKRRVYTFFKRVLNVRDSE